MWSGAGEAALLGGSVAGKIGILLQVDSTPHRGTRPLATGKVWNSALLGPWGCQPLRPKSVGPTKQRNQASDESRGPPGLPAPANPPQEDAESYDCQVPGCNRTFPTARGRSVHQQRAHKDWTDAQLNTHVDKARWTKEEAAMLARKEAELTAENPPRFLNQELVRYFPGRTLEAIKARRKRQDHKDMVVRFREEGRRPQPLPPPIDASDEDEILGFLEALPRISGDDFQANQLHTIIREARTAGRKATKQKLALYLRKIFPPRPTIQSRKKITSPPTENINRRQARKNEYALTQRLWKKDRRRCIANIVEDLHHTKQPDQAVMEPYWTTIMTAASQQAPVVHRTKCLGDAWRPISTTEIKFGRLSLITAAGPDGVSARLLRSIPVGILCRLFNLLMWSGLPEDLLLSKTIFLPKKAQAETPEDFRPITIPSVIVRSLHKILARRLMHLVDIDHRQRGFRNTDGCADNTFLLDTILRQHRRKIRPLYMASIDVSKAFDSVSHPAIQAILTDAGLPEAMIAYMRNVYHKSRTCLFGEGWTSKPIHPQRGVKQGDPLSPVLFNILTNGLLRKLPDEIGTRITAASINAAAYADDLLLFAETQEGLQRLINESVEFLGSCGMTINVAKSMTISIKAAGHLKKTAVDTTSTFKCNNDTLPSLRRTDEWRYLGIRFNAEGRTKYRPTEVLHPLLESLSKAPLKPQQRLFALRNIIIPKLYHQLALGAITIGMLNKADKILRGAARRWLGLPHDIPIAYFHTNIKDGGLGIPSLRWVAPLQRLGRLLAIAKTYEDQGMEGYVADEIKRCKKRLTDHGELLDDNEKIKARWAKKLYESVDGGGLKESGKTPHQHQWLADGTAFLTGKDFINCGRLRINAVPTRSRTARGRTRDRRCRAGCMAAETLNHVLQQCHRTHAGRIRRHDAILNYMERRIRSGGYTIFREPRYQTGLGIRKPDLVAILGRTAVVVDAQVVSEQTDLDGAHRKKCDYYKKPEVLAEIRRQHSVQEIMVTSASLSWRGIWAPKAAEELHHIGFITTSDLKILASRVLIGGIAELRTFNATTSTVNWRAGVG